MNEIKLINNTLPNTICGVGQTFSNPDNNSLLLFFTHTLIIIISLSVVQLQLNLLLIK